MDLNKIEELVVKAKAGDVDAKEEILISFRPFILNLCKKTYIYNFDFNDLLSECYQYLLHAIDVYDVNKHRFVAYGTSAIKNNLNHLIKVSANRNKIDGYEKFSYIDDYDTIIDDNFEIDKNLMNEDIKNYINSVIINLNSDEIDLYKHIFLMDMSLKDYSNLTKTSYNIVYKKKVLLFSKLTILLSKIAY